MIVRNHGNIVLPEQPLKVLKNLNALLGLPIINNTLNRILNVKGANIYF